MTRTALLKPICLDPSGQSADHDPLRPVTAFLRAPRHPQRHNCDTGETLSGSQRGVLRTRQAERSGGIADRAAAGSKGPRLARGCRRVGAEHSTGPQLVKVGETDSGECVEEVCLGGAEAMRGLGASAKGAASCHTIIVWATPTALPSMQLGYGEVIRDPCRIPGTGRRSRDDLIMESRQTAERAAGPERCPHSQPVPHTAAV
jgi:hypothetical protein